jgi:hypothetical protein
MEANGHLVRERDEARQVLAQLKAATEEIVAEAKEKDEKAAMTIAEQDRLHEQLQSQISSCCLSLENARADLSSANAQLAQKDADLLLLEETLQKVPQLSYSRRMILIRGDAYGEDARAYELFGSYNCSKYF